MVYIVRWWKEDEIVAEHRFENLTNAKMAAVQRLHLYKARQGATSATVTDLDEVFHLRVF